MSEGLVAPAGATGPDHAALEEAHGLVVPYTERHVAGLDVVVTRQRQDDPTGETWLIADGETTFGTVVSDRNHEGWFQVIGAPWPETANCPSWSFVIRVLSLTFRSVEYRP